jgi:hypothetical protein
LGMEGWRSCQEEEQCEAGNHKGMDHWF